MISFLASLFGYILNFIYNFIQNYGLAIILFSILIKILMIPISIKQQKTMKKNLKMQEKMKEIQFKYKNNPEMLNQATIELYKSEKINPFGGCLSAIIQIILLLAVFYLVRSPLTYMKKVDANVIEKYSNVIKQYELSEISGYPEIDIIREIDNIKELRNKETTENSEDKVNISEIKDEELDSMQINMNFLGLNLAQIPTKSSDWKAYIIPALYVIVSVISMRLTTNMNSKKTKNKETDKNEEKALVEKKEEEFDPMAQMNKNMSLMFPIMYLAVALIAPLGLALYWLTNSLLMIVERLALNKLLKDEEEK